MDKSNMQLFKYKLIWNCFLLILYGAVIFYSLLYFWNISYFLNYEPRGVYVFLAYFFLLNLFFLFYFLKKEYKLKENHKRYINYLITIFTPVIFFLGIMGIISIDNIVSNRDKFDFAIFQFYLLSLYLIGPIYSFLSILYFFVKNTKTKTVLENKSVFNAFKIIIKYILLPFIFFCILLHLLIILVDIKNIVIFSISSYIYYYISYHLIKKNEDRFTKFLDIFRKILPYFTLILSFKILLAIYLIMADDITFNRYLIFLFGLWSVIISCYLIFSKKKKFNFIHIFSSFFIIIIAIGPYSLYYLPAKIQGKTLETNLIKAGILDKKNRKIILPSTYDEMDKNLSRSIYLSIKYLCNFHNCYGIKKRFPEIYKEIQMRNMEKFELQKTSRIDFLKYQLKNFEGIKNRELDWKKKFPESNSTFLEFNSKKGYKEEIQRFQNSIYRGVTNQQIVNEISGYMKIKKLSKNHSIKYNRAIYSHFYVKNQDYIPSVTEKGYDKIVKIVGNDRYSIGFPGEHIVVDSLKEEILYKNGENLLEKFNFSSIKEKLKNTRTTAEINDSIYLKKGELKFDLSKKQTYGDLEHKHLTFNFSGKKYDLKLYFTNLNIKTDAETYISYYENTGYALIKNR